jgi:hypothetical protein
VKERQGRKKNTDIAEGAGKTPTWQGQKTPTGQEQKTPTNYLPREILVVGESEEELTRLLQPPSLREWNTRVKRGGLLLLMDFVIRNHKARGLPISHGLADGYVSEINHPRHPATLRKPLQTLAKIGWLEVASPACAGPHHKVSARYRIPSALLQTKRKATVALSPKLAAKQDQAEERKGKRLAKKHPFRPTLLQDLKRVGISAEGRRTIHRLLAEGSKESAINQVLNLTDGDHPAKVSVDGSGQISTNLSQCPKELKGELLLDGERVALCDISHAHHCFLPLLARDRGDYLKRNGAKPPFIAEHYTEADALAEFLSDGDYYRKLCINPDSEKERKEKKLLATMLLNFPNEKAKGNALYRRLRKQFPFTFGHLEDLKSKDHRSASKRFRHYTAKAINSALLRLQGQGIPAIPHVDEIICPESHRRTACEEIGKAVHEVAGARCKVDGVRFSPDLA